MVEQSRYFKKYIKLMIANPKKSGEDIYNMLELWHIGLTGKKKCKDYASFRSLKSQWYKYNRP